MANIAWIKYLQIKHDVDLSKGKMVLDKSIVKSQLNPKIENGGLIRLLYTIEQHRFTRRKQQPNSITNKGENYWNTHRRSSQENV